jgi:hypothetical protein
MVEYDGGRYHRHVNTLRPFTTRVVDVQTDSVPCDVENESVLSVNTCSIIYDNDVDFGKVVVLEPDNYQSAPILPSQLIPRDKLYCDRPGLCTLVQHTVELLPGYAPMRLCAYRVPCHYQDQVNEQVAELLHRGFIEPSTSPQASPLVVVLTAPDASGLRSRLPLL